MSDRLFKKYVLTLLITIVKGISIITLQKNRSFSDLCDEMANAVNKDIKELL